MDLDGIVSLVTGGTKGIGLAVAEQLGSAGSKVAICARSDSDVDREVAGLRGRGFEAWGMVCDVRDHAACTAFVEGAAAHFGRVDVLVNNAGVGAFAPIQDMSADDWHWQIETNLNGVFYCSKAAIPHLMKNGGGWIINIASLASRNAFSGGAAYNASKFGLLGMTEAMMLDLRHDGIRCSIVMPGSVDTEFRGGDVQGDSWKLGADDVARAVMDLLRYPGRAHPSRIELRPSRPPQR